MDRLGAPVLQLGEDLHLLEHLRADLLQLADLADRRVELAALGLDMGVALALGLGLLLVVPGHAVTATEPEQGGEPQGHVEALAAAGALLLAPRQQVDLDGHGRALIARPQAVSIAGASPERVCTSMRLVTFMRARGLAMVTSMPLSWARRSASPGSTLEPPASTM